MSSIATIFSVCSVLSYSGFVILGVRKFGLLPSYSSYAAKWTEAVPINRFTHLWSIVTLVVGLLLIPAMLEAADGSAWQFLGFFAPLYLWAVAFTPEWETDKRQRVFHVVSAVTCAALSLVWIVFVLKLWFYVPIALFLAWCGGYLTGTMRSSLVFWGEMAMFAAVYGCLLIGG